MNNSASYISNILCETRLNPENTVMYNTDAHTAVNAVSIITGKCWEDVIKSLMEQAHIRGCLPSEKVCVTEMVKANGFKPIKLSGSLYNLLCKFNSESSEAKYLVKIRSGLYCAVVQDEKSLKYLIKGAGVRNPNMLKYSPEKVWIYIEGADNRSGKIRKFKQYEMPAENTVLFGYNENPSGRSTGDCVIRALSTVYKCSWHDALDLIAEKTGYAEPHINSTRIINRVLKELNFEKHSQNYRYTKQLTGKQFCEFLNNKYSDGERIFAYIGKSHCVAIVPVKQTDGTNVYKVSDTWDSTDRLVGDYWVCKKFSTEKKAEITEEKHFTLNESVLHPQFGNGTIIEIKGTDNRILKVDFGNDCVKQLSEKWLLKVCG